MPILLQINVTANWGSTGKIADSIGLAAINKGWESYIAYGRYCNHSKSKLIRVGSKLDTYIHYGLQKLFDNEGLNSRSATNKLIKHIKEIKPDVVQLHNIHDHYLNYKILYEYLNQTDINVVWTFHDCWAFTGHCFHFVEADCVKWRTECGYCPFRNCYKDGSKSNFNLKKRLFTANKNLTIVPVSKWMESFVKESFLKDKYMKVIKNGVDLKVYKTVVCDNLHDTSIFKVLAVSNVWHKRKGLYDVFKLREKLPVDYEIIMVGLSAEQIISLPNGIKGIERTQNVQELVALYSEADVLINPTYADTYPTVNLEALACGTPVITYKTGGSPESVDDKTGIVISQGDVDALAEAVQKMRSQPISSDACRRRAVENFDKDKCFEKYIELYNELLTK